MIKNWIKRT